MIPTTGKNFKKIHKVRVTCPGWFKMELPNEAFFLLATVAMITVKMSFTHFHSSSCQGNIFLHQIHVMSQKLYLVSFAKNKDPSIRVKMHQTFFYHYLPYICWVDVIYLTCLAFLKSPWWLVWIFCTLTPLT